MNTLFEQIFEAIAAPILQATDAIIAAMVGLVSPLIMAGVLLFVVGTTLWQMFSMPAAPLTEFTKTLLLGAACVWFVTSASGYAGPVRDFLLVNLSGDIGGALAGAVGAGPLTGSSFDRLVDRAFAAGNAVYKLIPWTFGGLGLMAVVVVFWAVSVAAVAVAFMLWFGSFVVIAMLVGLGPLFVGLFLFRATYGWAMGWWNTVLAAIILQVLITALLALMFRTMEILMADIIAAGEVDVIAMVKAILFGMILFLIAGGISFQLPRLASSIAHGSASYGNQTLQALAAWGSRTMRGGGSGGVSGRSSAPAPAPVSGRATAPPGRSLSNP